MIFGKIFITIWSFGAICLGLYVTSHIEKSIQSQKRGFERMYKATGFPLFKWQAADADSTSQRFVTLVVAIVFIVWGAYAIWTNLF